MLEHTPVGSAMLQSLILILPEGAACAMATQGSKLVLLKMHILYLMCRCAGATRKGGLCHL